MLIHRIKWRKLRYINNKSEIINIDRYIISNNGVVYDLLKNKIVNQNLSKIGYLRVWISNNGIANNYYVHRLVASTFIDYKKEYTNMTVNHIDGNKLNNNFYNLEWISIAENIKHAINNGLTKTIGENTRCIDEDTVNHICKLLSKNYSISDIADIIIKDHYIHNRSLKNIKSQIRDILKKRSWTYISDNYDFSKYRSKYRLPLDMIEAICKYLEMGMSQKDILSKINYLEYTNKTSMQSIIHQIYKRKIHIDISNKYNF